MSNYNSPREMTNPPKTITTSKAYDPIVPETITFLPTAAIILNNADAI